MHDPHPLMVVAILIAVLIFGVLAFVGVAAYISRIGKQSSDVSTDRLGKMVLSAFLVGVVLLILFYEFVHY